MSFPSSHGRSKDKARFACRWTIAVRLQQRLVLALFLTGASRVSQAQGRLPAIVHSAEAQLEDGRTTLDEHTLMTARRSFEDCTREDPRNSQCVLRPWEDRFIPRRREGKAAGHESRTAGYRFRD